MKKIICIGHITKDKIITPTHTTYNAGGTSFYFANALQSLNKHYPFELVTKGDNEIEPTVSTFKAQGINVKSLPSKHTVYFENAYGNNPNERKQRVLAVADPFTLSDIQHLSAHIYHIGALLNTDFSTETLRFLATNAQLSIDAQGFLRGLKGSCVVPKAWKDAQKVLSFTHTLKVNEDEIYVLSGLKHPKKAALLFAQWGVKEVVITLGSEGSIVYADNVFHEIPAYPTRKIVDVTGCGDTYMACYLYARATEHTILESGHLASALCAKKIEHIGALTIADVREAIAHQPSLL
jgi:putative ribokinase